MTEAKCNNGTIYSQGYTHELSKDYLYLSKYIPKKNFLQKSIF